MSDKSIKVRLLFVDDGEYHNETISLPAESVGSYDRLIDFIREDPLVLQHLHVDTERLCAVYRVES